MRISVLSFFLFFSLIIKGSNKSYFVIFKDKASSRIFNPKEYFDFKAIENKQNSGLPIYDWYDLPVSFEYISKVADFTDSLGYDLRWFNGVSVYCSEQAIIKIKNLSFVKSIYQWNQSTEILAQENELNELLGDNFPVFSWQLNTMGGRLFQKRNLKGSNIRISIIDVGFRDANNNEQLKHAFSQKKIIDSWDFSTNKPLNYSIGSAHGTMVSSFIVGRLDTVQVGHAPESEILFAKIKSIFNSNKSTEEAWLKAVEWSYQKGARLVNSSVGYVKGSHTHEMLTGDSCLMSLAGNLAARKGMLIINAAGNEGANDWKMISFPSDADSVLAVGAIDSKFGVRTSYSSYGPSKDLNLKPNVTALGNLYWFNGSSLKKLEGTSFSTPLVTGFAACILQNQPYLSAMELMDTIQKSSSLYPYFDYSHGYGVPRATLYFNKDTITDTTASVALIKSPNYLAEKYYYLQYLNQKGSHIFYQILDKDGFIREYKVVKFEKNNQSPRIYFKDLEKGEVIRVFHRGTYIEKKIE